MVFITAGMGGGTGTGASAHGGRDRPGGGHPDRRRRDQALRLRGTPPHEQAERASKSCKSKVDSLVIIPNERLKYATDQKITFANAFEIADDVLRQAVQSISDLIRDTGFINLDFADVTAIMKDAGWPTWASAAPPARARPRRPPAWPFPPPAGDLHQRRQGVLINVTGSMDIGLEEASRQRPGAAGRASRRAHHLRRYLRRDAGRRDPRHRHRHRL